MNLLRMKRLRVCRVVEIKCYKSRITITKSSNWFYSNIGLCVLVNSQGHIGTQVSLTKLQNISLKGSSDLIAVINLFITELGLPDTYQFCYITQISFYLDWGWIASDPIKVILSSPHKVWCSGQIISFIHFNWLFRSYFF